MKRKSGRARRGKLAPAGLVFSMVLIVAALCGCGPQTPEEVVKNFYKAMNDGDYNAYVNCLLPDEARRMSVEESRELKNLVEQKPVEFENLKLKVTYDKKNKNKATVEVVQGAVKYKNPQTGKSEKMSVADIIKREGSFAEIPTRKYKGRWYVDI
ncbi:MAG: DUF4878 domain-containing protein [Actinomycetota bacterium]|nr:DUF4878 domain-containing protein [Actinomycetota bacterium]